VHLINMIFYLIQPVYDFLYIFNWCMIFWVQYHA
jgi:hypothetical protein